MKQDEEQKEDEQTEIRDFKKTIAPVNGFIVYKRFSVNFSIHIYPGY